MLENSLHKKLNRIRKNSIGITYQNDACESSKCELPFILGIMGDFSGHSLSPQTPLAGRKFISIDRDNFNDVMAKVSPSLNLMVSNKLEIGNSQLSVQLRFHSLNDFEPESIVKQVEPLRVLLETRAKYCLLQSFSEHAGAYSFDCHTEARQDLSMNFALRRYIRNRIVALVQASINALLG